MKVSSLELIVQFFCLTNGQFLFEFAVHTHCGLIWAADKDHSVLPNAVYAGRESNGQEVYVARGYSGSDLIPGKFLRNQQVVYLEGGKSMNSFQLLTNPNGIPIEWVNFTGTIPSTAILAGSQGGKPAYIGRSKHNGDTVAGYLVQPNDQAKTKLSFSWGDALQSEQTFEILITPHCKAKRITTKLSEVKSSPAAQKMAQQMYNQQGKFIFIFFGA